MAFRSPAYIEIATNHKKRKERQRKGQETAMEDDISITAVISEVLRGTDFVASDGLSHQITITGQSLGGAIFKLYHDGSKIYCRAANNWRYKNGSKHGVVVDLCDPNSFNKLLEVIKKCKTFGLALTCQQCPYWSR